MKHKWLPKGRKFVWGLGARFSPFSHTSRPSPDTTPYRAIFPLPAFCLLPTALSACAIFSLHLRLLQLPPHHSPCLPYTVTCAPSFSHTTLHARPRLRLSFLHPLLPPLLRDCAYLLLTADTSPFSDCVLPSLFLPFFHPLLAPFLCSFVTTHPFFFCASSLYPPLLPLLHFTHFTLHTLHLTFALYY